MNADNSLQDVEAKAKKDQLADLDTDLRKKADIFDNVRGQARSLGKDAKDKSGNLEGQKSELGKLEVRHLCPSRYSTLDSTYCHSTNHLGCLAVHAWISSRQIDHCQIVQMFQSNSNEATCCTEATQMQDALNEAKKQAEHLRGHLKDAEAKKPELDNTVRAAYKIVETNGQDIGKLENELDAAEKHAADLERQAKEAR